MNSTTLKQLNNAFVILFFIFIIYIKATLCFYISNGNNVTNETGKLYGKNLNHLN